MYPGFFYIKFCGSLIKEIFHEINFLKKEKNKNILLQKKKIFIHKKILTSSGKRITANNFQVWPTDLQLNFFPTRMLIIIVSKYKVSLYGISE